MTRRLRPTRRPEDESLQQELAFIQELLADRPAFAPVVLHRLGTIGAEARIDVQRLMAERAVKLKHVRRPVRPAAQVAAAMALVITSPSLAIAPAAATETPASHEVALGAPLLVRVHDTASGKPIEGVTIKTVADEVVGRTDAAGQAALPARCAKESVLQLERPGYPLLLVEGRRLHERTMLTMRRFADSGSAATKPAPRPGSAAPRSATTAKPAIEVAADPAERLYQLALEHAHQAAGELATAANPVPPAGTAATALAPSAPVVPAGTVAAAPRPPADMAASSLAPSAPVAPAMPAAPGDTVAAAPLPPAGTAATSVAPTTPAAPAGAAVAIAPAAPVAPAVVAPRPAAETGAPRLATPRETRPVKRVVKIASGDFKAARAVPVDYEARLAAMRKPGGRALKHVAKVASADEKAPRAIRVLMRAEQPGMTVVPRPDSPISPLGLTPDELAWLPAPASKPAAPGARPATAIPPASPAVRPAPLAPIARPAATAPVAQSAPAAPSAGPAAAIVVAKPAPAVAPVASAAKPAPAAEPVVPAAKPAPVDEPVVPAAKPAAAIAPTVPVAKPAPAVHGATSAPTVAPIAPETLAHSPLAQPASSTQAAPAKIPASIGDAGPLAHALPVVKPVEQPALIKPVPHGPTSAHEPAVRAAKHAATPMAENPPEPPRELARAPVYADPAAAPPAWLPEALRPAVKPRVEPAAAPVDLALSPAHSALQGQLAEARAQVRPIATIKLPTAPRFTSRAVAAIQTAHSPAEAHRAASAPGALRDRLATSRRGWRYVVKAGDMLSSIAQRELGSATLWPVIYAANRDVLTDPSWLRVGVALEIPRTASALAAAGARVYVVRQGDCLSSIARDQLGSARRWPQLYAANRHLVRNPWLIFPGQRLVLPVRLATGIDAAWADLVATEAPPIAGGPRVPAAD